MKKGIGLFLLLLFVIFLSGCDIENNFKFQENKFDYQKSSDSILDKINQENMQEIEYYKELAKKNEEQRQKTYNENYNLSYIAKMKNYSYPIKVAVVEFNLPNTSYVSYGDMSFLDIVNNEKDTMILLPYDEDDVTNTYMGYMKHLDYEIASKKDLSGVNISYLQFKDLYTHSFKYSEVYMKDEYKRITGIQMNIIEIDTFGPYEIDSIINRERKSNATQTQDFKDQFDKELNKTGIDFSNYDIIGIVFFDDGRFGFEAFVSFADVKNSKFYVQFIANQGNIENGLQIFIHELTHILGASDKYDISQGIGARCLDTGLPDPEQFGGDVACLMCGTIQLNETTRFTPNYLSEVKICDTTANEIGWI